jgi:hypothetical protein
MEMGRMKATLGDTFNTPASKPAEPAPKPAATSVPARPASTAVGTSNDSNPWLEYGEAASAHDFEGDLLKFSKGDFLAGRDNREIPLGTRFVVNMDSLEVGWVKWEDNRPVGRRMGRVIDEFKPPRRNELDDNDPALWGTDDDGKPRDPWQFSNNIVLAEEANGCLYTFTTSSKGGIGAIGELCKTYGQVMRQHPDEWPIVALDVDSYAHANKSYGRIKFPIFEIVGWAPKDSTEPAPAAPPVTPPPTPAKPAAAKAPRF